MAKKKDGPKKDKKKKPQQKGTTKNTEGRWEPWPNQGNQGEPTAKGDKMFRGDGFGGMGL